MTLGSPTASFLYRIEDARQWNAESPRATNSTASVMSEGWAQAHNQATLIGTRWHRVQALMSRAGGKLVPLHRSDAHPREPALEITLSIHHITEGSYMIDVTPSALPDGKFAAHAVVTHQVDKHVEDLWPEFDPFVTEAEAASAAHMAALAWVAHRGGDAKPGAVA